MKKIIFLLISISIAMGLTGCVGTPSLKTMIGDSWQEEALQHDGSIILIKRSQSYRGMTSLGDSLPVGESSVSFTAPNSKKTYKWVSEFDKDIGRSDFNLLAVHVLNDVPYIVAEPSLCLSYNKWERPNPPYLIFKAAGNGWEQITLAELPDVLNTLNVMISTSPKNIKGNGPISASRVKARNDSITNNPQYKKILRAPLSSTNCPTLIKYKCGWGAPGKFSQDFFDGNCN